MSNNGGMDNTRAALGGCRAAALYYDRKVRGKLEICVCTYSRNTCTSLEYNKHSNYSSNTFNYKASSKTITLVCMQLGDSTLSGLSILN